MVELFRPLLTPIARSLAAARRGAATEEDLVQAGAIALLETAGRFETYLRRRVTGAMQDSVRKRDYRDAQHRRFEDIAPLPDPAGNLDDFVMLSELWRSIDNDLTARQREIVSRVAAGENTVEIAASLGVSHQAISRTRQRAVNILRLKMAA